MQFGLGEAFGVANFEDVLFAGDDSDKVDAFAAVDLASADILVISEVILSYFDMGKLSGNSKRFNSFVLLFGAFGTLALPDIIFGC